MEFRNIPNRTSYIIYMKYNNMVTGMIYMHNKVDMLRTFSSSSSSNLNHRNVILFNRNVFE